MSPQYMAVDQYGETFHGLEHPRRDLLERLNRQHAGRMYIDHKDGSTYHTGYIIAGHWLSVYGIEGAVFATKVHV